MAGHGSRSELSAEGKIILKAFHWKELSQIFFLCLEITQIMLNRASFILTTFLSKLLSQ